MSARKTTQWVEEFRQSPLYREIGEELLREAQQQVRKTGSGRAVLDAVATCALHDLVMPDWLAVEFLRRYRGATHYTAKSWDDLRAFGPPHAKNTNLAARRKALLKRLAVFNDVRALHAKGRSIEKALFAEVGGKHCIGATLAEELYYEAARNFPKRTDKRKRTPANS
jgi:hypothetical protein